MTDRDIRHARWSAHPVRSALLRTFVFVTPLAASIGAVHVASRLVPMPKSSLFVFIAWWLGLSAAGTIVLVVIDRASRRLLPLAALLKLSLVFPDEVPSRFRTALRSGTVHELERRVGKLRSGDTEESSVEAAERLLAMVAALNSHDRVTRGHSERVRAYTQMIAREMRLAEDDVDLLNWAGLLHDVGKLDIPYDVLNKAGRPSQHEWQIIRSHPEAGERLVAPLRGWLGQWLDAVGQHHERWDGRGYPRGLSSDRISLAARIVAVADAFDVMTSARSYKSPSAAIEAREEIARCADSQFDPRVVRAFLNVSLGRLRFAMGPLAWLAHAPILGRLPLTPAIGTLSGTLAVGAAALSTGLVQPAPSFANPLPSSPPIVATQSSPGGDRAESGQPPTAPEPETDGKDPMPVTDRPELAGAASEAEVVNAPPIAVDDRASAAEAESISIDPLANDRDPEGGRLTLVSVGSPSAGAVIRVGAGVRFTAPPDFSGTASFSYSIADPEGATDSATVTIVVGAVNDAPSFVAGSDQVVLEDAGAQSVSGWASGISAGPADESGQSVSFLVSNDNGGLFAAAGQPAVSAAGTLTFTPALNENGVATVTVRALDDGGTANGGVDTSAPQSFTIVVGSVNDAPSFVAGSDQVVLEDAGAQSVSGWASGISAGPADESGQSVSFLVSNDNGGLFAAAGQPAVSAAGTLTFTPALNENGVATVTVRALDDGGTANGGVDTSAPQSFTIVVGSVNDAPSFVAGSDQVVLEDAGAQSVSGWASGISAGPADESGQSVSFLVSNDNGGLFAAAGQPAVSAAGTLTFTPALNENGVATVTVRALDDGGTANGGVDTSAPQSFTIVVGSVNDAPSFVAGSDQVVLEDAGAQSVSGWASGISAGPADESGQSVSFLVSNDNGGLFAAAGQPAVSAAGTLTFTPALNENGVATVTVRALDDGGTANGGVDTSAPQSFTIVVGSVNDAPSFVAGSDQVVLEDAGAQSVSGWASGISAGPADESGQSVSFLVSNDNGGLFAAAGQPAVSAAGTLTFTPALNENGVATVTVRALDDGGTANGGVDTSAPQSFTIVVGSVNDAPSFVAGSDQVVLEDAGAQSVSGWASGISAGPADESGQSVSFLVSNDNGGLFAAAGQPAVSAAGTLTFTPALNENGVATVTVRALDDGGTANGGVDTSAPQSFTITVVAVDDPPLATDDAVAVDEDDPAGVTFDVLANDTDADGDTLSISSYDGSTITYGTLTFNGGGSFTYVPDHDFNGAETFTYTVTDGTGNVTATVTVTVNPVADLPIANDDAYKTSRNTVLVVAAPGVLANDFDEDGDLLTVQTTPVAGPTNGTLSLGADGSFTYTPNSNFVGSDTFTYRVDAGGASNDAVVTITVDSGVSSADFYLGTSGSSADVWNLTTSPPAAASPVPDFDGDGEPGLTIKSSGGDEGESDPRKWHEWSRSLAAPLELDGPVVLQLWSAVKDFATGKTAHPFVYLYDCAAGGSACVKIAETAVHTPDWNGVTPDWVYREITIGSVTRTIAAGRELRVRLLFKHEDVWVAMTAAYPSGLGVTRGNSAPVAQDDSATVLEDSGMTNLDVLANDTDLDLDPGSVTVTSAPSKGSAAAQPDGTIDYTPDPDVDGSDSFDYEVCDTGGQCSAATVSVTITPVNDAPSFTAGADQSVANDSGAQSVPGWATNISTGPVAEAGQTVSFTVTNDDNSLFTGGGQPAVSSTGTLTYTPAPGATGVATVTVRAVDDGGTANGGADTSAPQTFTVTVFTPPSSPVALADSLTVLEDSGTTNADVLANDSDADGNLDPGTLSGVTSPGKGSLSNNGNTFDYTLDPDANGSDTFDYEICDTTSLCATATVTITITPVNDAPSFTAGPNLTVSDGDGAQSVLGWATGISAGPADEGSQVLTFTVNVDDPLLFLIAPILAVDGTLSYTPTLDGGGVATATVVLNDDGGTANGGADSSPPQIFTITVVND